MIDMDTSHAPLIAVHCNGEVTRREIDEQIQAYEGLIDSGIQHALLIDVANAQFAEPAAPPLLILSQWLHQQSDTLSDRCIACGIVVEAEHGRDAIEAFLTARGVDFPTRLFTNCSGAVSWLSPVFEPADVDIHRPAADSDTLSESSHVPPEPMPSPRTDSDSSTHWSPYQTEDPGSERR